MDGDTWGAIVLGLIAVATTGWGMACHASDVRRARRASNVRGRMTRGRA